MTSATLRSVRVAEVVRRARDAMALAPWKADLSTMIGHPWSEDDRAERLAKAANPAPADRPDPHAKYRAVAQAYLEEQAHGRGVHRRLAERYAPTPSATIRGWVRKAEELGFLGPGTRGRLDREPGPRLNVNDHRQHEEQS